MRPVVPAAGVVALLTDESRVLLELTFREEVFSLRWQPSRGRAGTRVLAPAAAAWLIESAALLAEPGWRDRFRRMPPGRYPLASSPWPDSDLGWQLQVAPKGSPALVLSAGNATVVLSEDRTPDRLLTFSEAGRRLLVQALDGVRPFLAEALPETSTWPAHQLLRDVTADGWPLAQRIPTGPPRAFTLGDWLERALLALSRTTSWVQVGREGRFEVEALRSLLPWSARYAGPVLERGFILVPVRVDQGDAFQAYRLNVEVFGCDPLLSTLAPLSGPAEDGAELPWLDVPQGGKYLTEALRQGLVGTSRRTQLGRMPLPTPSREACIRFALDPQRSVASRYRARLRELLVHTACEILNSPRATPAGTVLLLQRLALLAWDLAAFAGTPVAAEDRAALDFASTARAECLFGTARPARLPEDN